ncbi:MAG: PBSX family phage terminase large subunit [Paraclostridium sp.]
MSKIFHAKQQQVYKFATNVDFFMLINSGAKRSGKTHINNFLFLRELKRVSTIAKKHRIGRPQYILAGVDLGALRRNVLNELEEILGREIKLDKHNRFRLMGVTVCCFGHSKINDLGRIRGFTSFGAYVNEGTMANEEVFNEIKSRCSGVGARVLVDTNPDHPNHWLKTNYIDVADGKTIKAFNFTLEDNTFLNKRYIENIKKSTPSDFMERDIYGRWTTLEGVVYKDFNPSRHYVSSDNIKDIKFKDYFCGVDFGYEHLGAIVLCGIDFNDRVYLLEEHSAQHQDINYYLDIAKNINERYGGIFFYCDSARPEYVNKFIENGLNGINANKSVLSGIETVATLMKNNNLIVVEDKVDNFKQEVCTYAWNKTTGEPIKTNDDVLDALRYAIYSHFEGDSLRAYPINGLGI